MTDVETATTTLNDLMDQREQLVARSAKLADERQQISYAALTGKDKAAQDRLKKLNDTHILANAELESISFAIAEATRRLEAARRDEAVAADRANALALRDKLGQFVALGDTLDDCFVDFRSAALEMKQVVDEIHRLGCATPDNQLYKVNCDLAFKTAVQGTPFWSQDFPAMRSHERKTFRSLVTAWAGSIEAHINARLGDNEEEAA